MKKNILNAIGTVLAFALAVNCCLPIVHASAYNDVSGSDWHSNAIDYVTEIGLMEGVGNGDFQPNQPLTRAQVVALLYRLAGDPETTYTGQFQDVAEDKWYAIPVSWAYQHDIVHGISETAFAPASNITREQLAVILHNYLNTMGKKVELAENAFNRVKDCWAVSPYAEKGVVMVCESGLMNPDAQYNFNPKGSVSRADSAVVFMRLSKALAGEQLTGMQIPGTAIDFSKLSLSRKEKDAQALAVAKQIASVVPTERSDIGRIMIAAHIVSSYSKFCTYTMSGPDYWSAYGVFVKSEYSCAGSTRALGLVLTCMGYQWRHINENQYSHQWCELTIGGQTIVADGQTGEVGYKIGNEVEYVSHPFIGFVDPWPYTHEQWSDESQLSIDTPLN